MMQSEWRERVTFLFVGALVMLTISCGSGEPDRALAAHMAGKPGAQGSGPVDQGGTTSLTVNPAVVRSGDKASITYARRGGEYPLRGAAVLLTRNGHKLAVLSIERPGFPARVDGPDTNVPKIAITSETADTIKLPRNLSPGVYTVLSDVIFVRRGSGQEVHASGTVQIRA